MRWILETTLNVCVSNDNLASATRIPVSSPIAEFRKSGAPSTGHGFYRGWCDETYSVFGPIGFVGGKKLSGCLSNMSRYGGNRRS